MAIVTVLQFLLVVWVVVYLTVNMLHIERAVPVTRVPNEGPLVSVCVPARNEERDLEACLVSLLNQTYPNFEVILVDDHSTDRTLEIGQNLAAEDSRLRCIQGKPLPEGWLGKPYALVQAVAEARGEYLLFTDADPVFEPCALATAMDLVLSRRLDVLSLLPAARFGSFWERVVQPVMYGFIGALTRFRHINSATSPKAMAVGAFILFRRDAYEKTGGHESVRQEIVEDVALAHCAKKANCRLLLVDGKSVFSIRMYYSLREIWEGWRKNIFSAFKGSVTRTLFYAAMIAGFVVTPFLVFLANLVLGTNGIIVLISLVTLSMVVFTGASLCQELGMRKIYTFLFPLGASITVAIMLNSMRHTLFDGGIEWRGRKFDTSLEDSHLK